MPSDLQNDYVDLVHGTATARVYFYGATLTAWSVSGEPIIFLSPKALLDGTKPIRGGIPLVFPQFGPGKLPQHGFARNTRWEWAGIVEDSQSALVARFRLTETPATLAVWPFHFQLTYTVALRGNKLITALDVQNTEPAQSFPFTTLLHSYFRVKDGKLQEAAVRGLKDTRFLDKVREGKEFVEENAEVRFAGEVDRVYQQTQGRVLEIAGVGAKGLRVETTRFEDVVVWNPAAAKAKSMGDLGEDQFPHFVCVEVGTVNKAVDLAAGTSWSASQTLSLL